MRFRERRCNHQERGLAEREGRVVEKRKPTLVSLLSCLGAAEHLNLSPSLCQQQKKKTHDNLGFQLCLSCALSLFFPFTQPLFEAFLLKFKISSLLFSSLQYSYMCLFVSS